ncbi:D-alanyl-D-alanine carboxypeptidase [Clostridium sp. MSJ-11]|uniref:D-alanyl-D-alanine carboxypeptidase n=1 Tax=Clostridium mobile TaxID=2841512 RepID=A0ABS6EEK5_9CLOT|nr:D-alanyl-D-alanine carboxypeptidase family protein [Clostridium mobile]MBU5482905.1 D-alanyl-D-alanine carboxypeptidase [Clostridium mobile]
MKIKFKKIISLLSLFTFLTVQGAYLPLKVKAEGEGINVEASSAILIEPTSGKIIYEKNPHEKLAPASVTKVMTMLIAMEAIDSGKIKLTDKITVSEEAKNKGKNGNSSMLLDTGEIRTVEEILKGIAIASGNDAATAMAEYIAGSEEAFVKMMNDRAQELGMKNTTFKNPSGLSAPGHETTAHDIALMSMELIKHPKVLKYTGTYMETISEGRKSPIGLVNHNKLVRFFKGCDGLKTGFTNEAKYCISATAVRDGVRMLAVIMGAPTYKVRNRDASMLMNYGFSKFESIKVLTKDDNVEKVQLGKNEQNYFIAKASEDFNHIVERGNKDKITKKCVVNLEKKHYNKGEVVGVCEIYSNEKLIGKVKIYCDRDIKKAGFLDNLKFNFKNLFNNAI